MLYQKKKTDFNYSSFFSWNCVAFFPKVPILVHTVISASSCANKMIDRQRDTQRKRICHKGQVPLRCPCSLRTAREQVCDICSFIDYLIKAKFHYATHLARRSGRLPEKETNVHQLVDVRERCRLPQRVPGQSPDHQTVFM